MAETVLVVEDDPSILRGLQMNLGLEGFRTVCAHDGEEALAMMRSHKPDLMLLDLMLPKLGGLEVIKRLRVDDPDTPIIVLSAKDQEGDKVLALSLGADDYVTKPFSIVEVIARIRVALRRRRRAKGGGADSGTRFGVVELDVAGRRILVEGSEVDSTAREFDLLLLLALAPGHRLLARAADAAGVGAEPLRHRAHRRQLHRPPARQDRGRPRRAQAHRDGARRRLSLQPVIDLQWADVSVRAIRA